MGGRETGAPGRVGRSGKLGTTRRELLRGIVATGAASAASHVLGNDRAGLPVAWAAPTTALGIVPGSKSVGAQVGRLPRILMPADFAEIKTKIAAQAWARDSFGALRRTADGLVRSLPPIPDQGGGWFHAGGAGYEVTRVHNRLAEGARTLGLAYRLTDDPAAAEGYAQTARAILLGYAARYVGYEAHDQYGRTGPKAYHPGKVLSQGLDEGIWLAALAFGFDLVQETLSEEDRRAIADGVLRPAAELLSGYNVGRQNHQTYYNLGIGLAGLALDEQRFIEHAILKADSGLLYQLSPGASFTSDGFWYEGSAHYHYYALEGILGLAEAAQRNGFEPYALPTLRGAFDFPLAYADGMGRLPAFNDGPPANLYDAWRARQYEVGYARYGDPRYGALLARTGRGASYHALVYGKAGLPGDASPTTAATGEGPSTLLADRTIAVLRAGQTGSGPGRLQLTVNGMWYVGGHTQPAQLEIELTAGAHRIVPAPASIKYADPMHAGWYRQTVSHSTVIVDGKSQARGKPVEIVAFQAGALAQVARMRTASAYPGSVLDRTTILLDAGLIDLFQVRSLLESDLDWALHHAGQLVVELPLQARRAPPLPGYQELESVQEARTDDRWRARWTLPDGAGSTLWVDGAPGTMVLAGQGMIGAADQNNDPQPVSALIVRREAKSTAFLSVLLPGDDGSAMVTVRRATRDGAPVGSEEAVGLVIRTPRAAYDVWIAAGAGTYQIDGRVISSGQLQVERTDGSGVQTEVVSLG